MAEGGRRKDVVHVELAGVEVLGHGELGVDAVLEKHLQPRRRPLVIPGNTNGVMKYMYLQPKIALFETATHRTIPE